MSCQKQQNSKTIIRIGFRSLAVVVALVFCLKSWLIKLNMGLAMMKWMTKGASSQLNTRNFIWYAFTFQMLVANWSICRVVCAGIKCLKITWSNWIKSNRWSSAAIWMLHTLKSVNTRVLSILFFRLIQCIPICTWFRFGQSEAKYEKCWIHTGRKRRHE